MLRARAFPDKERKTRQSKMLKEARKSEKQKTLAALPDGKLPHQVEPEKLVAFRFDQELIRRLVLRQPLSKIIQAMGKDAEPLIHARLADYDFREKLDEYTLGGVQRLEAEIHDSLNELKMILRLSADEMMHIALGIARRTNAKDSDRLSAINMVMDRAQALVPARTNAGEGKGGNVFNFGDDVVREVLGAFKEMAGPQNRLVPAERMVGSMTVEERDELRQLAVDENG